MSSHLLGEIHRSFVGWGSWWLHERMRGEYDSSKIDDDANVRLVLIFVLFYPPSISSSLAFRSSFPRFFDMCWKTKMRTTAAAAATAATSMTTKNEKKAMWFCLVLACFPPFCQPPSKPPSSTPFFSFLLRCQKLALFFTKWRLNMDLKSYVE